MSVTAALSRADKRRAGGNPAPVKDPRTVPLDDLRTDPEAFQVRGSLDPDTGHVAEIAAGIGDAHLDEPLGVWWDGLGWCVIDGHHRHAAYLARAERGEIKATHPVPVRVHQVETAAAARGVAAQVNSRGKRQTTLEERTAEAWRLVCAGEGSKAQQAERSQANVSTVGRMRAVFKRLHEGRGIGVHQMEAMGWEAAQRIDKGQDAAGAWTDALDEKAAQEWAKRIGNAIKVEKLVRNPDRLARALAIISPDLPRELLQAWTEEAMNMGWAIPDED